MTDSELVRQIDLAEAVSFDVFDTLFVRPLADPEDIFDLLGSRFGIRNFRDLRRQAQTKAFERMAEAGAREITLRNIYDCFSDLPGHSVDQVMEAEIQLELALTLPNPRLKDVFLGLIQRKLVVLTSDMYLPESFFNDLMVRHNLPKVPLFLSAARNATKRDFGELFDIVSAELGVPPERILHIGDNPTSDVVRARERGLNAFHYRDVVPVTRMAKGVSLTSASSIASALPRSNAQIHSRKGFYDFGFRYAGPAARGFLHWLRDQAEADGIDKLLFVSRDGYVLEKMAERGDVEGLPSHAYLHGSRVAFTLAATLESNFDDRIDFLTSGAGGLQPREVLERIGVRPPAEWVMRDIGLGSDTTVNDDSMARLRSFLHAYRAQILQVCHRNRRGLFLTLRALGIEQGMRVGLVDVGWRGSTQEAFAQAVARMIPIDLTGYYLGLSNSPECRRRRSEMTMRSMLDDVSVGEEMIDKIYATRVPIELMFSAPHEAVIGYETDGKNAVTPVMDRGRGISPDTHQAVGTMLEGALDFSERFNEICRLVGLKPDPMSIIAPLLGFVGEDHSRDMPEFDSIKNFDAWSSSRNVQTSLLDYGLC